ncbi:MAG TPA: dTDP-4-dehydrorhamnose 3,5-epimerase [bacterium (Candidatus Stahlbacteria)]|nr:dTDP-4-dehydrorhamnose 3,5-epimerase [Candidatus Stahlbacteria bacterium]
MISGVKVKKLKFITDDRGRLIELLRSDDEMFLKFGQVYLTTAHPGVVKAWHGHRKQYDNITCIKGMIKFALHDDRVDSETRGETVEYIIGEDNPLLIQVPPLVWHGFKNIGTEETFVINVPTEAYNHNEPDELRRPPDYFPYEW